LKVDESGNAKFVGGNVGNTILGAEGRKSTIAGISNNGDGTSTLSLSDGSRYKISVHDQEVDVTSIS
jgi:hypothetical protein